MSTSSRSTQSKQAPITANASTECSEMASTPKSQSLRVHLKCNKASNHKSKSQTSWNADSLPILLHKSVHRSLQIGANLSMSETYWFWVQKWAEWWWKSNQYRHELGRNSVGHICDDLELKSCWFWEVITEQRCHKHGRPNGSARTRSFFHKTGCKWGHF